MNLISTITRSLYVVDRSLRKEFREDYYKRCMYAAFGTTALLHEAGFKANIVGGDFLAFVVARFEQRGGRLTKGDNPCGVRGTENPCSIGHLDIGLLCHDP
jgi:hypothetical protein